MWQHERLFFRRIRAAFVRQRRVMSQDLYGIS